MSRKRSGFPSSEADYSNLKLNEIDAEIARLELMQRVGARSSSLRKNVEESIHRLNKYRLRLIEQSE